MKTEKPIMICVETKKIIFTPKQIEEKKRKLELEHSHLRIPGVAQVADWDGQKRAELDKKLLEISNTKEETVCLKEQPKEVEKKPDIKTTVVLETKPQIKNISENNKPKKKEQKNFNKKKSKKKKNEIKSPIASVVVKINAEPPVVKPLIQENSSDPEIKLQNAKLYFQKNKLNMNRTDIDIFYQKLAREMTPYRGQKVFEDFIKFSASEIVVERNKK